ncbi:hypothetical protein RJ639_020247 [Escallonia herrerae]|uniref:LSM domain-containing protein n=1 Tax=Escallonia herrerae TaxID=1293975 RepID=A0AA88V854_9ASTE|nr:hypothetical protein RJ639_020247 [Escallonia herrerae]
MDETTVRLWVLSMEIKRKQGGCREGGGCRAVGDPDDPVKTTDQTRRLGLIVCRGTAVMLVSPTDGTDEIANPFTDGA